MPLSFFLHLHDGFFNNWIKTTLFFLQSKIGHADKTPYLCTHQFCRMAERILHWFQKHCISQAFSCLMVMFQKIPHLGDNICDRFNAVSINISYKTYKSTKSSIVLQNHLANVQKNHMSVSNGIMRLITRISKFSCCLHSVKIVCIRSDSVLKIRLFFAKCCHFCRCNTFKQKTAVCSIVDNVLQVIGTESSILFVRVRSLA